MKELIKTLLEEGKTYSEISRDSRVGVCRERVRQIAKENGWRRRPFLKDLPKDMTEFQKLKASGKNWCSKCKTQDENLIKPNSQMCNPCNSKRFREYYHTPKGREVILKAKAKYESKKNEKN